MRANENKNKAGVAVLTSDKVGIKAVAVARGKEGHSVITKGSGHQEGLTCERLCGQRGST